MVLLIFPDSFVSLAICNECSATQTLQLFCFLIKQFGNVTLFFILRNSTLVLNYLFLFSYKKKNQEGKSQDPFVNFFLSKLGFSYFPNLFSSFPKESLGLYFWILRHSHQRSIGKVVLWRRKGGRKEGILGGGERGKTKKRNPYVQNFLISIV